MKEYDTNGNCIHYRDSTGCEWWREYVVHSTATLVTAQNRQLAGF